jgi:hypothetical protein
VVDGETWRTQPVRNDSTEDGGGVENGEGVASEIRRDTIRECVYEEGESQHEHSGKGKTTPTILNICRKRCEVSESDERRNILSYRNKENRDRT